jgi:hypothetical protein
MLRGVSGHNRNEIIESWAELHKEELSNVYSSPNIIRMNKSRRM